MNVCVFGLWHLGSVTAACLTAAGHNTTGLDPNEEAIAGLQEGKPPLFEPGLQELINQGISNGRLKFTTRPAEALKDAEIVWVTFDTPVDANDHADTNLVIQQIEGIFPQIRPGSIVLISSQLPVGTTSLLAHHYTEEYPENRVAFAYSPENLRLGHAIEAFQHPDRVVIGAPDDETRQRLTHFLSNITSRIEWMSIESAEMTKHALNAFLATSVVFINEIASICEQVGADAREVERGLKSEARIGPRAYLKPGGAFGGGTLARDVVFLESLGETHHVTVPLLEAVLASNVAHRDWAYRRLGDLLGDLAGKTISVLGLTYKPGTDTLRRSIAVELCHKLSEAGAVIQAHDPVVKQLPPELASIVTLYDLPVDALKNADAAVIATDWPEFSALSAAEFTNAMRSPIVLSPNHYLASTLGADPHIRFYAVGLSGETR